MNIVEMKAYAKVNLGLDVVRRLDNGYHEVKMIMQAVDIFDTITLQKADAGIALTADSTQVPCDENNLIYKAAALMKKTYHIGEGVAIHLKKRIPVAAGMAGGSTDAAAVLKGMNQLFSLDLKKEELMTLGLTLGADVPYCIMGGTALACGIGEKLTALPDIPRCYILVAKPDLAVSTKYVYENLNLSGIATHPDIDGMVHAISKGNMQGIVKRMSNVLESVTETKYPVIAQIKKYMVNNGALMALMSGSGPTVFGIYNSEKDARQAMIKLTGSNLAKQIFVTKPIFGEG